MGILGGHTSVSGGLHKAFARAEADGFASMQVFLKNQNRWEAPFPTEDEIRLFREARTASTVGPIIAHDSYLINLASPEAEPWEKSIAAFADELDRAAALGVEGVVTHPGSHLKAGEEAGLARIAVALDRILDERPGQPVRVLLETTAGQGTNLGHRFEHLRDILGAMRQPERCGICVDTCHILAAGYDIRTTEGYEQVMDEFDRIIGLSRIAAFHLNDSKMPFGSRKDRHEHIGQGHVGLEAFRCLVNDRRFAEVPMVLETDPEVDMHRRNLELLQSLIG